MIERDAAYVAHRLATWDNRDTQVAQSIWMAPRDPASHPGQDIVDVMTFLVAPAAVTVSIGESEYTYQAPAGVFDQAYPLELGRISATVTR